MFTWQCQFRLKFINTDAITAGEHKIIQKGTKKEKKKKKTIQNRRDRMLVTEQQQPIRYNKAKAKATYYL